MTMDRNGPPLHAIPVAADEKKMGKRKRKQQLESAQKEQEGKRKPPQNNLEKRAMQGVPANSSKMPQLATNVEASARAVPPAADEEQHKLVCVGQQQKQELLKDQPQSVVASREQTGCKQRCNVGDTHGHCLLLCLNKSGKRCHFQN